MAEHDTRFAAEISGFFHDFLRAAGIPVSPGIIMTRIQGIGEKMSAAIGEQVTQGSIKIVNQLQDRVLGGFLMLEESFNTVKHLQETTSAAVLNLINDQKIDAGHIKALQDRVQVLENDRQSQKGIDHRSYQDNG